MNRELKFRIWCKMMQRWLCEDSQFLQMDGKKVHAAPWSTIEFDLPNENYIVQQYTGLKDKNGVDIFEGDLVRYSTAEYSMIAPVVFSPFGNGFVLDSSGRHLIGDSKYGDYIAILPLIVSNRATYEVVGNIFENE